MSSFHTYTSWGRTRRPKNLAGADGTDIKTAGTAAFTAPVGTDNDVTQDVAGVELSGKLLTIEVADATGFETGKQTTLTTGPLSLRKASLRVVNVNLGTKKITVLLEADAANEVRSVADVPVAGKIRQRTKKGLLTENQRFLHITNADAAAVTAVWVYNYAVGKWSELKEMVVEDNADAATDASLEAVSVKVPANSHRIIDVSGADRVVIVHTDGEDVFAAGSTF